MGRASLPIGAVLPQIEILALPDRWTPVAATVLAKCVSASGDAAWVHRSSEGLTREEVLGVLRTRIEILTRQLLDDYVGEDDGPETWADDPAAERGVPVDDALGEIEIEAIREQWTPVAAVVLVKCLGAEGESTWAFRTTDRIHHEELLGALLTRSELLLEELRAEQGSRDQEI